jgi:hypothetical protein
MDGRVVDALRANAQEHLPTSSHFCSAQITALG